MESSTIDLPPKNHEDVQRVVVEAEEGKIAMFSYDFGCESLDYYTFLQNDGDKAYAWHLKNTMSLPTGYEKWKIENAAVEGYIFLVGIQGRQSRAFSLEIKTFTMKEFGTMRYPYRSIHPYFGFPPSMSPRSLQGYDAVSFCFYHSRMLTFCDPQTLHYYKILFCEALKNQLGGGHNF